MKPVTFSDESMKRIAKSVKRAGSPGKFEGVPDEDLELAERLYEESLMGMADDEVSEGEGQGWWGLFRDESVILFENEQGFIDLRRYDYPEEAQADFDRISEEIYSEMGEDGEW